MGAELSIVLKNIYALGAGIYSGLGYGDNFIAAYVANCLKEMKYFVSEVYPNENRHISDSVYLGDLLVTAYSTFSRNRLFGIVRYGLSSFKYDVQNNAFSDPVYGTTGPLELNGQKATAQWLEIGLGVETKLWSIIRLGWSIRYKSRLSLSHPDGGEPYFIPGFGKNDGNGWGGTVNVIFDVGKTAKKAKKVKNEQ